MCNPDQDEVGLCTEPLTGFPSESEKISECVSPSDTHTHTHTYTHTKSLVKNTT